MSEAGARRIKRSLLLDQNSVRFLDETEVRDLEKFIVLKPYFSQKRAEIETWNQTKLKSQEDPVNSRRLTNIGTIRAYVLAFLQSHPRINQDFTLLVRQLAPSAQGLPLEIYCFTDTIVWSDYESIQADIFDHLLAILPEFDLRVFQDPSGSDFVVSRQV